MRQKGDKLFIQALNNLASGQMTEDDITLINSRSVKETSVPKNAIRLYYENRLVDLYNDQKIVEREGKLYQSEAKDYIFGSKNDEKLNLYFISLKREKLKIVVA